MRRIFSKIFSGHPVEKDGEDRAIQNSGERQAAKQLNGIRADHRARYYYAAKLISTLGDGLRVLDAASGVGYGSYILAARSSARVTCCDIDEQAVEYGEKHYGHANVERFQLDLRELGSLSQKFDVIVSFETIEHVSFYRKLLKDFNDLLEDSGTLFVSTPNQTVLPFTPERFPHHIRHFTDDEFSNLLNESGLEVVEKLTQYDKQDDQLHMGFDGLYNVYVCRKWK